MACLAQPGEESVAGQGLRQDVPLSVLPHSRQPGGALLLLPVLKLGDRGLLRSLGAECST